MNDSVTIAKLREDLATVMKDAEALMSASAEHGGEKLNDARARVRESIEAAKARVREAEQAVRQRGDAALHDTEDYVKSNPWQAMGIAAGLGLVIGVLVARR